MDLKSIKLILDSSIMENSQKELAILSIIGLDPKAVPYVLEMVESKRKRDKELIEDANVELSRALIALQDPALCSKNPIVERTFVVNEIAKHYHKWKDIIKCCFNVKGLP